MADLTTEEEERRLAAERRRGVALADEDQDELPALLAIAVGIAILAVTLVWPTIAPSNDDDTSSTAAVAEEPVEEDVAEEADAPALPDVPAMLAGLGALGLTGIDLNADGNIVTATGEVPDETARQEALDFLADQPHVDDVIDNLTIAEATAPATAAVDVAAAQASVVLTGTVPDEATKQAIFDRAAAVYSEAQVDDQLVVDPDAEPPVGITISGTMTDDVLFNQITNAFNDLDGVEVDNELVLEESGELESSLNSLEPIQFASGSDIIDGASAVVLDEAAEFLNANPDVAIEIGGHTDSVGSDESNQTLSQARADAVAAALGERGVTNDITAVGFGERRLKINPDDTAEARAENRRIEFRILS